MATATFTFSFTGSATPAATTFLSSKPLDMSFSTTYELEASDAAHVKTIQKEFQSYLEKSLKGQLGRLNTWLGEKDAIIAGMVKRAKDLEKGFPSDPKQAAAYTAGIKVALAEVKQIDEFSGDYQQIVSDWAENWRGQQALNAIQVALKSARVKTFNQKGFRVKAGLVVKAVLVIAAVALGIAAIVLSAGAAAPLVVGLAAAGLALSGITSLGAVAKSIAENANTEKKLLANVQKDVEAIQAAFGGALTKGSSLRKHVTELANLIKIREDQIQALLNDVKKYKVEAVSYAKNVAALSKVGHLDASKLKAKEKACNEMSAKLDQATAKIAELQGDNAKARELLKGLTDFGVSLDKLSGEGPNSLLGNLKNRFKGIDGWLDLGNQLGGLVGGAGGLV